MPTGPPSTASRTCLKRNWSFITLPVAFSGSSARNSTNRGTLKPAIRSRLQAISSWSVTGPLRTTKAFPTCPSRSSGTPITATCPTAGCSSKKPSISAG
jgi:hypothetical protein